MPIYFADGSIDPVTLLHVPEKFIIFYSSIVHGKLWCPDCEGVDNLVKENFGGSDSPDALVVYVGDRSQWKSSSNVYRSDPWNLTAIPTIVRLEDGKEVGRLVMDEISTSLAEFVKK